MTTHLLTLSNSDTGGGAAHAAIRLHQTFRQIGIPATMSPSQTQRRCEYPDSEGCRRHNWTSALLTSYLLDRRPLSFYPHRQKDRYFSLNWFPTGIAGQVRALNPDVVHLHWIGQGFVPVGALRRFQRPLVWTLHDQWALTGGCYWTYDCRGYEDQCGCCPQLGSTSSHDLSRWNLRRKRDHWRGLDLTIISPSRWLAECARQSSVFKNFPVEVIPNGIDPEIFRPLDQHAARAQLNLPQDRQLILFGAVASTSAHAKGFHLLQPALHQLAAQGWASRADLVIFGNDPDREKTIWV